MYLLNASKSYYSNGKTSKERAKKRRFIFFYDEIGNFHKQRVSFLQYFFKKYFHKKAHIKHCLYCQEKFVTYHKWKLLCDVCRDLGERL